jgi:Protein of unknown function (DUF2949)
LEFLVFKFFPNSEIESSIMATRNRDIKLLNFLQNELELSNADIAVALRHRELENGPLPMLLWQYGLVDLEQLGKIFDWLAEHS